MKNENPYKYRRWGVVGLTVMFWCFAISGIILRYSSASDFNYTKGKLVHVIRFEEDVHNRFGAKTGTAHTLKFTLTNSETIFYIDNNFTHLHYECMQNLESSNRVEVWSDGDLIDGDQQRVYQLKVDGNLMIALKTTKDLYVEKSQVMLYIALVSTLFSLYLLWPRWIHKLIIGSKKEEESMVKHYLRKFEHKKTEELENIVNNKPDFQPDAVTAANQILKKRKAPFTSTIKSARK